MKNTKIIILAGGKGKRMKSELPKVLMPLNGKPMITHLLSAVEKTLIAKPPVIVVGHAAETIKKELGDTYHYVHQKEQLGTGHATQVAVDALPKDTEHVLVLYGDHPLVSDKTIHDLAKTHLEEKAAITMGTVKLPDFEGDRACFTDYGRVIRDENGNVINSIETKDATPEERNITEVNPCYYCFDVKWLRENLPKLKNQNAQKEYYLTDVIHLARENGDKIASIPIDARDAMGANTPEQLKVLESLL